MEHGFDQFLTVGTYVFFRKKKFDQHDWAQLLNQSS